MHLVHSFSNRRADFVVDFTKAGDRALSFSSVQREKKTPSKQQHIHLLQRNEHRGVDVTTKAGAASQGATAMESQGQVCHLKCATVVD